MSPANYSRFMSTKFKVYLNLSLRPRFNGATFCTRHFSSNVHDKYVLAPAEIIDIPNISLHKCVFDGLEKYADRTFMVDGEDGSSYTFAEAREKSFRFSSALTRLGVAKGDVVAIVSPNCHEYFIAFFGTIILGAIITPVSPHFTADEIARQLNDSGSSVVICHKDCFKEVNEALKGVQTFRHLILIGEEQDGAFSLQKLLKVDGEGNPPHVELNPPEDVAILPYSSGTTGLPKGVMLTHANMVANIFQSIHPTVFSYSAEKGDVIVSVLPFYHIYGCFIVLISCMIGAKNVVMKKYDTPSYVKLIQKYKATTLYTVPPILSALCNNTFATPERLASVQRIACAAAPIGPALYERFLNKFGQSIQFFEGYGMTELSPSCSVTREGQFVNGSCGSAIPNTYTKLVNPETGESLGPEAEGELCIKGPQVMKGYWKNLEATRKTMTEDGWLHTGDIAKLDAKGNIYIVDRIKELIKVKGLQVAPAELENLLRIHPSVEDVAVIGIPDEKAGEVPKAFIIPAKGHSPSEEELVRFVEGKVAPYKRLRGGVAFVEEIPKSASGKILRRLLRENMIVSQ